MPWAKRTSPHPTGIQQYSKLEHRLTLLAWLNSRFGYESNRAMLDDCKGVADGYAADGHSHLYHHLLARGSKVQIREEDLARYDEHIRLHLGRINRSRSEPITLRYFQLLAALYTEVFLDLMFNDKAQLLRALNEFVQNRHAMKTGGAPRDESFTEDDLTKLAYWMATGSGKTLLLHLNYYQYLHYARAPLDNILLITPNEGLSEQHLQELARSGIPARRFDLNHADLFRMPNEVQVLEITKLVEEKTGGGVRVPVEAFEGRNLIFVDEGHKGAGGDAWRRYREALGKTGFTFEYSATFGQALSAAKDDALTSEYGKAIIFDYSYRYFYADGFGKDFRILNLRDETAAKHTFILLLGNLLAFYEQLRLYEDQRDAFQPYNLEKPLWVFVGSTVNAVYKEQGDPRSDVLTVVRFLHTVLRERDWAVEHIAKLLQGKSGVVAPDGSDVFLGRFPYLRERQAAPDALYADLLQRVFHTSSGGGLQLVTIRSSPGELGLMAAGATTYCGVISIGDTAAFKKLVGEQAPEITIGDDVISHSLFSTINQPDSPIHLLIGAKKFLEGWNSWRVSAMGLLNIGQKEGPQIIQLFGRGVRLKGKDRSLKRSAALPGKHPRYIDLLETLNIFAVRANYMAQFREYLEREGVETEPVVTLPLFAELNDEAIQRQLVVPRLPENSQSFQQAARLLVVPDKAIPVRVDRAVHVETLESTWQGLYTMRTAQKSTSQRIPEESLALVDWEAVYLALLEYKARKGWHNLLLQPHTPRDLLAHIDYTLIADETVFCPRSFAERQQLQEAVIAILCQYLDSFYRRARERWEAAHLEYRRLDENDPNLAFNRGLARDGRAAYVVQVRSSDSDLIEAITNLLKEEARLRTEENHRLPRIVFDRHLYLPLLVEESDVLKSIPPALTASEARFVRDLKAFWDAAKDSTLAGKEIYLLRNLSRGRGIGFFEERGFYPDFILWIIDATGQRVIFVEPHGMLHAKAYQHDEKAHLWERLRDVAPVIGERSGRRDVMLDAYIISVTPFADLQPRYDDGNWTKADFAAKHILFFERTPEYDYMRYLVGAVDP